MQKTKKRKTYACDDVYNELINQVDCSRGAPLAHLVRRNFGDKRNAKNKPVYRRRVYLTIDNAYDKGGAYWGIGAPVYVEYTLDKTYVKFIRKE